MAVPVPVNSRIVKERTRYGSNNLVFPEDIGPQGMFFIFRNYSFSESRARGFSSLENRTTGDTVLLPLPKNLMDSTTLNLQSAQLNLLGEFAATAVEGTNNAASLGDIATNVQNIIASQVPSGSDIFKGMSGALGFGDSASAENLSKQIAFLMRRTLDRAGMSRTLDAGLGSTVNPKAALSFEGVNLKPHSFGWDFSVRSRRESDVVRNIFQTFKRNSLPEYIGIDQTGQNEIAARAMLRYPSMVDIFLFGIDDSYYMKFKTSMIQSVSINFSSQGNVIMEGGKPGMMSFEVQFLETDIHTSEDYGGDNSGGASGAFVFDSTGGGGR